MLRLNIKDYAPESLRALLQQEGLPAYRAGQLAGWLYARGVEDFGAMTDLGRPLRSALAARFHTRALEIEGVAQAADGTLKGALRAADGARIESVLIPERRRTTLCVSTQVGCPLACAFCATGAMGLLRNLSTAEIVDQFCRMREALPPGRRITHVVFMGMGEPLLNLRNVLEALRTLLHPRAFALAPRRVTVSTAGVAPRIADLASQSPVNLAVSLHATRDELRDVLVPLNRRFPIAVLLEALRALPGLSRRRPVFFEYTLMDGVNDSPAEARRLAALLRGLPSKVNLIPMNPHADAPYRPPPPEVAERFLGELTRRGITATLRRSRGADIEAACGQLAARGKPRLSAARGGGGAAPPGGG